MKPAKLLTLFLVLAAAVLVVWALWPDRRQPTTPATPPETQPGAPTTTPVQVATQPVEPQPGMTADEARAAVRRGLELREADKLVQARTTLSEAWFSGAMPAEEVERVRKALEGLADKTLFSRVVHQDDPYTGHYNVNPGEVLGGADGIVRRKALRVPEQLIVEINGLRKAENLRAGQRYKIIRGPFHAIIDKSGFVMDVYLQPDGLPKVFVRRLDVGIGKNGSTPAGLWRVEGGGRGKQRHATWNPPPSSPIIGPVPYGHPQYAFGEKGLWISLEGIGPRTKGMTGYGIHSTNDPDSVGKATSLGCVRLRDGDIEFVYNRLYPVHSTVAVRP